MIKLRTLVKKDVSPFYKWINDEEVVKYSLSLFTKINTKKEINKWFSSLINDKNSNNLGIYLDATDELIGYTGFCNISKTNKSGEYFIFIGEKEAWGKGIGTKVTEKILKIGFIEHQLNRIMLTVSEPNIGGLKAYKKAGFKIEGRLREASFRDNKFHDKFIMSILKSEWKSRKITNKSTILNTPQNQQ